MSMESPEMQIIRHIETILAKLKKRNDSLSKLFKSNDLRLAFIGLPGNVLHSYLYHFAMAEYTICRKEWWKIAFKKDEPNSKDMESIRNLESLSKHAFFVFFLARQEWNFRKLASHLKKGISLEGKSWKRVYNEIFNILSLTKYNSLFDICRYVRNSIHSNGIYISPKAKDQILHWKGKNYQFKHLHPISFMTHDEWFVLIEDNITVIDEVINHPKLSKHSYIPNQIHSY